MNVYQIKDWHDRFENNRTRDLKQMTWVPIPNKLDGDGYTLMMAQKNGASLYGTWISIVLIASKCKVRGILLRDDDTPHDAESISRITRIPRRDVSATLEFCVDKCKWLILTEVREPNRVALNGSIPHYDAGPPQDDEVIPLRREGKGREGKGEDAAHPPAPQSFDLGFAHIPTVEEVVGHGMMGSAIPEDYCRHFFERMSENHYWLTRANQLVDWRRKLLNWWRDDEATWRTRKNRKVNVSLDVVEEQISTHPANPEWVKYDKASVTQKHRDELDDLKKKRRELIDAKNR